MVIPDPVYCLCDMIWFVEKPESCSFDQREDDLPSTISTDDLVLEIFLQWCKHLDSRTVDGKNV